MALKNYTYREDIVRGGRWPAADGVVTVEIPRDIPWPADVEDWTWEMAVSRSWLGGTPDVVVEADVVVAEEREEEDLPYVIVLQFHVEADDTEQLPAAGELLKVDVRSADGAASVPVYSYYDCVAGTARVRNPAGEGT